MSSRPPEIGILIYPGAQMASVLGLTDLLMVAEGLAQKRHEDSVSPDRRAHSRRISKAVPRLATSRMAREVCG
jgi:transcriptional regulator GlxA family with amidase domain